MRHNIPSLDRYLFSFCFMVYGVGPPILFVISFLFESKQIKNHDGFFNNNTKFIQNQTHFEIFTWFWTILCRFGIWFLDGNWFVPKLSLQLFDFLCNHHCFIIFYHHSFSKISWTDWEFYNCSVLSILPNEIFLSRYQIIDDF